MNENASIETESPRTKDDADIFTATFKDPEKGPVCKANSCYIGISLHNPTHTRKQLKAILNLHRQGVYSFNNGKQQGEGVYLMVGDLPQQYNYPLFSTNALQLEIKALEALCTKLKASADIHKPHVQEELHVAEISLKDYQYLLEEIPKISDTAVSEKDFTAVLGDEKGRILLNHINFKGKTVADLKQVLEKLANDLTPTLTLIEDLKIVINSCSQQALGQEANKGVAKKDLLEILMNPEKTAALSHFFGDSHMLTLDELNKKLEEQVITLETHEIQIHALADVIAYYYHKLAKDMGERWADANKDIIKDLIDGEKVRRFSEIDIHQKRTLEDLNMYEKLIYNQYFSFSVNNGFKKILESDVSKILKRFSKKFDTNDTYIQRVFIKRFLFTEIARILWMAKRDQVRFFSYPTEELGIFGLIKGLLTGELKSNLTWLQINKPTINDLQSKKTDKATASINTSPKKNKSNRAQMADDNNHGFTERDAGFTVGAVPKIVGEVIINRQRFGLFLPKKENGSSNDSATQFAFNKESRMSPPQQKLSQKLPTEKEMISFAERINEDITRKFCIIHKLPLSFKLGEYSTTNDYLMFKQLCDFVKIVQKWILDNPMLYKGFPFTEDDKKITASLREGVINHYHQALDFIVNEIDRIKNSKQQAESIEESKQQAESIEGGKQQAENIEDDKQQAENIEESKRQAKIIKAINEWNFALFSLIDRCQVRIDIAEAHKTLVYDHTSLEGLISNQEFKRRNSEEGLNYEGAETAQCSASISSKSSSSLATNATYATSPSESVGSMSSYTPSPRPGVHPHKESTSSTIISPPVPYRALKK